MAEEFVITATFDASQLQAGFERATAVVKAGSEQMAAAMKTAETASVEMQTNITSASSVASEKMATLQAQQQALIPTIEALREAETRLAAAQIDSTIAFAAYEQAQIEEGTNYALLTNLHNQFMAAKSRESAIEREIVALRATSAPQVQAFSAAMNEAAAANAVVEAERKVALTRAETATATAALETAQSDLGTQYGTLAALSRDVTAAQQREAQAQAELNLLRERGTQIAVSAAQQEIRQQVPRYVKIDQTKAFQEEAGKFAGAQQMVLPGIAMAGAETEMLGYDAALQQVQERLNLVTGAATPAATSIAQTGQASTAATQGVLQFAEASTQSAAASKEATAANQAQAVSEEYLAKARSLAQRAQMDVVFKQQLREKYGSQDSIESFARALQQEAEAHTLATEATNAHVAATDRSLLSSQKVAVTEKDLAAAVQLKAQVAQVAAEQQTAADRQILAMSDELLARKLKAIAIEDQANAKKLEGAATSVVAAQATEQEAAATTMRTISIANGVAPTKMLTQTIEMANMAMNSDRPALYASALEVLQKQLAGTRFALQETAEGFVLVKAASDRAAASHNTFGGQVSYVTGRLMAEQLGLGATSFAVGMLARSMSFLAPIMMVMFVPTMAITLAEAVNTLVEKFRKLNQEVRDAQTKLVSLTADVTKHTAAIEIENLKLEDQIAKLEGRPTENKLAIALGEANQKAQELSVSLGKALEEELKTIENSPLHGWFYRIFGEGKGSSEFLDKIKPSFQTAIAATNDYTLALSAATAAEAAYQEAVNQKDEKLIASTQKLKEEAAAHVESTRKTLLGTSEGGHQYAIEDATTSMHDALYDVQQMRTKREADFQKLRDEFENSAQTKAARALGKNPKMATTHEEYVEEYMRPLEQQVRSAQQMLDNIRVAYQAADKQRELLMKKAALTPDEGAGSIDKYKEVLNQARLSLDAHHVITTKSEIDYWNNILTTQTVTAKQRQSIEQEVATLKRRLASETSAEILRLENLTNNAVLSRLDELRMKLQALRVTQQRLEVEYAPGKPVGPPGIESTKGGRMVASGELKTQLGVSPEAANLERVKKDVAATERAINEETAREYIRNEEVKFEEARRGSEERIRIAENEVAYLANLNLATSDIYDTAQKKVIQARRDFDAEQLKIAQQDAAHYEAIEALKVQEAQRAFDAMLLNTERNSAVTLAREEEFSDRLYEIHRKRLQEDLRLAEQDHNVSPTEHKKILDQIYELDAKHEVDKLNLHRRALQDRMDLERGFSDSLQHGIQATLVSMTKTYKDFFNSLRGMYDSLLNVVAAFVAKKIEAQIDAHILEPIWEKIFGKPKVSTEDKLTQSAKDMSLAATRWQEVANHMDAVLQAVLLQPPPVQFARQPFPELPEYTPAEPILAEASKTGYASTGSPYEEVARAKAIEYGVSPDIIQALIKKESNWNPTAISKKGALGLMQIMPDTAKDLGLTEPFNPEKNIDAGVRHYRDLYRQFNDDALALAAYNAGADAVRKYGNTIPPYDETQDYVKTILSWATQPMGTRVTAVRDFQSLGTPGIVMPPAEAKVPPLPNIPYAPFSTWRQPSSLLKTPEQILQGPPPPAGTADTGQTAEGRRVYVRIPAAVMQPDSRSSTSMSLGTLSDVIDKAAGLDLNDVKRKLQPGEMQFMNTLGLGNIFSQDYLKKIDVHEMYGSKAAEAMQGVHFGGIPFRKNDIWVNSAAAGGDNFSVLVHELTHTLQSSGLLRYNEHPNLESGNKYAYSVKGLKDVAELGNEQQASLVEDYTVAKMHQLQIEREIVSLKKDAQKDDRFKSIIEAKIQILEKLKAKIQELQPYVDQIERGVNVHPTAPRGPRFKMWSDEQTMDAAVEAGITSDAKKSKESPVEEAIRQQQKLTRIIQQESRVRHSIFMASQVAEILGLRQSQALRISLMAAELVLHQVMQARKVAVTAQSEAAQTAAAKSGSAARQGIGLVDHVKEIFRAAANVAVKAFKHVMDVVPIPGLDIALAGAAAAAAFAAVMAWGTIGGMATGGLVSGAGTGTSDSVPARLSSGEYVIRAQVVRQFGVPFFDTLNKQGGGAAGLFDELTGGDLGGMAQGMLGGDIPFIGSVLGGVKNLLGFASGGLVPGGTMSTSNPSLLRTTIGKPSYSNTSQTVHQGAMNLSNSFTISGAQDPEIIAKRVSTIVIQQVKRHFRTNGVL